MIKRIGIVKDHPVTSFFVLTFLITWGLGFSYSAVINRGAFLLAPLVFIATCGPALAGIILTAITNTEHRQGKRKAFWIAFFVAWVVSALIFVAHNTVINHAPFSPPLIVITFMVVAPVAFVIGHAYSGIPAVRSYLSSLIRLRGVWGWSLLALALTPALVLLSIPISSILGRQLVTAHPFPETGLALVGLVTIKFLYQLFFFNATGEEAGWRGFALPRLQARASPLVAALILTLFWAPWHFFLWQAEGKPVLTWQYWIETYVNLILATVLIVWFYNRSKGSILVAGILHAGANTTFWFFPELDFQIYNVILAVVVLMIIMADRMWQKLPLKHPAVFSDQKALLDEKPGYGIVSPTG